MPKSENLWFEVEMFDLIKPKAWPIFLFLSRFKRVVVNKLEFTFSNPERVFSGQKV